MIKTDTPWGSESIIEEKLEQLLAGPRCPKNEFILSGCTYQEVYETAFGLKAFLSSQNSQKNVVCLCAESKAVIAAAPSAAIFPGSEHFLKEGLENGGMGCISATCNVNPAAIRHVYDVATGAKSDDLDHINNKMVKFRKAVERCGPIPAMKGLLAEKRGDSRWRNVRPPIMPASLSSTDSLLQELGNDLKLT